MTGINAEIRTINSTDNLSAFIFVSHLRRLIHSAIVVSLIRVISALSAFYSAINCKYQEARSVPRREVKKPWRLRIRSLVIYSGTIGVACVPLAPAAAGMEPSRSPDN